MKKLQRNLSLKKLSLLVVVIFTLVACNNNDELKIELPVIETIEITDKMYNQITVSGMIVSDGGDSITEQGVCWSNLSNPTIDDFSQKVDLSNEANFSVEVQNLNSNVEYYVCTYAINRKGISYGKALSFTLWLNYQEESAKDIDGNSYKTIRIGDQVWMQENLKVTHYRNGDPITYYSMQDDDKWLKTRSGAYCAFNDDEQNKDVSGFLYNGYAVFDERKISPEGWHVPSKEELETLLNYLGGNFEAGHLLRKRTGWSDLDPITTNLSGFSALPGGVRLAYHNNDEDNKYTEFREAGKTGFYASSDKSESVYDVNSNRLWYIQIFYNGGYIQLNDNITQLSGQSIRCIKD